MWIRMDPGYIWIGLKNLVSASGFFFFFFWYVFVRLATTVYALFINSSSKVNYFTTIFFNFQFSTAFKRTLNSCVICTQVSFQEIPYWLLLQFPPFPNPPTWLVLLPMNYFFRFSHFPTHRCDNTISCSNATSFIIATFSS